MITQYNATNADLYNKLFAKASVALGNAPSYTPVVINDANEYAHSLMDGVEYYVDFVYNETQELHDEDKQLKTDFLNNAYYIQDEDGKYVRAFTYDPSEVYYTLTNEKIAGYDNNTPAYVAGKTYYIASSAITTLEEYFCQLKNLLNISYKYIMLPLDEPALEIDANKRTITIPANFRTSGLSVEGDQLAETLFFKVARFFDAMDLSTCDIAVQWILPSGEKYMTSIYMIDIESDPGNLIFACPLTAEITKVPGTIELAVRFYKLSGDNTISYSLNTLPVKANIGKALEIGVNPSQVTESTVKDLFISAIENSDMASGEPAPAPVFTTALGAINLTTGEREINTIYLEDIENNTLTVGAKTNPAGVITYTWYHTPITGGIGKIVYQYKVVNDISGENYQKNTYYVMNNGIFELSADDYNEEKTYYTREQSSNSLTLYPNEGVSVTGTYQVKSVNKINNKTARAWSNIVTLPAPAVPELSTLSDTVIEDAINGVDVAITASEPNHTINTYTWKKHEGYTLVAEDIKDTFAPDTYYTKVEAGKYKLAEEYDANATYYIRGDLNSIENSNVASLIIKDPGYYHVQVDASMNGDTKSAESNEIRVTNLPDAVTFAENYRKTDSLIEFNVNLGQTKIDLTDYVNAPAAGDFTSDSIEYHWYVDADTQGVLDENNNIVDTAVSITYDTDFPIIEGLDAFGTNTSIRCVAVNTLNDRVIRSESVRFLVSAKPVE